MLKTVLQKKLTRRKRDNNIVVLFLITALLLLAAADINAAERSGHLILTIGHTTIEDDTFEDQGVAFKLGTGVQYSDYFAMEFYFVYYGEATDEIGAIERSLEGWAGVIQAIGIVPVTDYFRLMGKAGISVWDLNSKDETLLTLDRSELDGDDVIYGAGALFDVDHDSTVRLEYEYSKYDDYKFSVISVGFQHYFQ